MSVRIEASSDGGLACSGDFEGRVTLAPGTLEGRFSIAFSDGILVDGRLREGGSDCTFEVLIEGAGIVRIEHLGGHEALVIDWRMEWMMLGGDAQIRPTEAGMMGSDQLVLGFVDDLVCAA